MYLLQLPIIVVANKIDVDATRTRKSFGFIDRRRAELAEAAGTHPDEPNRDPSESEFLPLFFASASDGTNVVSIFREAIKRAVKFKEQGGEGTFVDEVLAFIQEEERRDNGLFAKQEGQKDEVQMEGGNRVVGASIPAH